MDDISFVAGTGASLVAGVFLWWTFGRYYESWPKKSLAILDAIILGYVVYLIFGTTLVIIGAVLHPERARQTGEALGQGFKTLPLMLIIVVIGILSLRGRSKWN
jgi:hypothetical protein